MLKFIALFSFFKCFTSRKCLKLFNIKSDTKKTWQKNKMKNFSVVFSVLFLVVFPPFSHVSYIFNHYVVQFILNKTVCWLAKILRGGRKMITEAGGCGKSIIEYHPKHWWKRGHGKGHSKHLPRLFLQWSPNPWQIAQPSILRLNISDFRVSPVLTAAWNNFSRSSFEKTIAELWLITPPLSTNWKS